MSLEATHIRFALDLQNNYQIENIDKYISGAVYPDSRYVTGIERKLTHDNRFLLPEFATDDFRKGWQTHQICDLVYTAIRKKIFPEFFPINFEAYEEGEWILSTAMKIIQDMDDMQLFDIQHYLKCLEYVDNPNGESLTAIKDYNEILINLYRAKKVTGIEENIKMWYAFGVEARLCERVRVNTEKFLKDPGIIVRLKLIYQEMIDSYPKIVEKRILDKFGK